MDAFDFRDHPRRLNLGCGFDRRDGYLNVDLQAFHEPDLVADVRELGILPDDHYEEILAIDVLEHLPRTATGAALREWHRLLVPVGTLSLRVPSVEGLCRLFHASNSFERHQELMQCLFGTQAYTGDFHLTSFTRVSLEGFLAEAGFSVQSVSVKDEWLFEVTAAARKPEAGSTRSPSALEDRLGELVSHPMPDDDFVDRMYRLLLDRAPDPEGRRFYVGGLEEGAFDRSAAAENMMRSDEFRARASGSADGPG